MSYHIFASVIDGLPSLTIRDSASGQTVLVWTGSGVTSALQGEPETRRLFRQLLLLSCRQELANTRVFTAHPCATPWR